MIDDYRLQIARFLIWLWLVSHVYIIKKSKGLRFEPWDTTHVRFDVVARLLFTRVYCTRFDK